MEMHLALSDDDFVYEFERCKFDPIGFTHEAHLRLAWIYLGKLGLELSLERIQKQLKKYVRHVGAKDKYNTTLTIAAVKAVNHYRLKSNTDVFSAFIVEFPQLKYKFRQLMDCHYGFDIYNSDAAKNTFLEPDLLQFD